MMKMLGAAVAAGTLTFAGSASAATVITMTFSPNEQWFDLFDYSLGDIKGRYTVALRSNRAFTSAYGSSGEWVEYHLHPVSGPSTGAGWTGYGGQYLGTRTGQQAMFIDFESEGSTEGTGCCWPSGNKWVPYEEHYYRDSRVWVSWEFLPGDDPITVTLSLAPIPEPSTWAMMIAGFSLAGEALRRRRRVLPA